MTSTELAEKLQAGCVKRCHTVPSSEYQTTGLHSWGVAIIILNAHPNPSLQLIKAALQHDMAELWLGDVPATAKWRFSELSEAYKKAEVIIERENNLAVELTDIEYMWLKAADILELAYWCELQRSMGSLLYKDIFGRCVNWLDNHIIPDEIKALIPSNSVKYV